jgi:hypothetical protein
MKENSFFLPKLLYLIPTLIQQQRTIIIIFYIIITLCCSTQWAIANTFFFYNPESNINDFRSLKSLFDTYLQTQGDHIFQPFDKKEHFEKFLDQNKTDIFLLSSWHYQNLVTQGYSNLKPLLVGTIDGGFTYTQVLSTKENINNISELSGKRIASAMHQEYSLTLLKSMNNPNNIDVAFEILTVPKDIDALMSVLFGIAQGALTARNSLTTLASINPKKAQLLHPQLESQAMMLPMVVAYLPITQPTTQKLLAAIENMSDFPAGKEILGMLGLNGWKKLTETDRQQLIENYQLLTN